MFHSSADPRKCPKTRRFLQIVIELWVEFAGYYKFLLHIKPGFLVSFGLVVCREAQQKCQNRVGWQATDTRHLGTPYKIETPKWKFFALRGTPPAQKKPETQAWNAVNTCSNLQKHRVFDYFSNIVNFLEHLMFYRFKMWKVDFHRENRGILVKCQSSREYKIEPGSGKLHP